MRLTILGCGTSSGVPRIGGDWGSCDPGDPRNRRSRASVLIETDTTALLIDTGPDLRSQLLASEVVRVDAVIWTHEHADHTHGIDDLRQLYHLRGAPVAGYARADTVAMLENRFHYVFHGRNGYPPTATLDLLTDSILIGDIRVHTIDQPHGRINSAGLRFEHGDRLIGYATDFSHFTAEMLAFYEGLDLFVVDALRKAPHPTHADLGMVLAGLDRFQRRPQQTLLTHMDQSMDYATLAAELPADVAPGVDALCIEA